MIIFHIQNLILFLFLMFFFLHFSVNTYHQICLLSDNFSYTEYEITLVLISLYYFIFICLYISFIHIHITYTKFMNVSVHKKCFEGVRLTSRRQKFTLTNWFTVTVCSYLNSLATIFTGFNLNIICRILVCNLTHLYFRLSADSNNGLCNLKSKRHSSNLASKTY